jgi:colicin import membrane protein
VPIGFIASFILHGVLLGWALLAVVTTPPLAIRKPEAVEVAFITEGDFVRLKQGDRAAKVLEAEGKEGPAKEPPKKDPPKPTPPPPPQAAAPPPPAPAEPAPQPKPEPEPAKPEPAKAEPPKPDPIAEKIAAVPPPPEPKVELGPTPDDQKKLDEKLKEQERTAAAADAKAKADAKAAADAKAKADAKARADAAAKAKALADAKAKEAAKKQDLAALVNDALQTTPDKSATNAPPKALIDKRAQAAPVGGQKTAANAKGPSAGAPEGTDTVLTADKASMLAVLMKNNVRRCWNVNAGLEGAAKLVVRMEVKLDQAGKLIGDPKVVNASPGPQFEDAANSARRAVIACQPYANLPPELYNGGWDYMLLILDPAKMF